MTANRISPRTLLEFERWRNLSRRIVERATRKVSLESALDLHVRAQYSPVAAHRTGRRPLRIMFVAPRNDYGSPARGLSIEENYFFHALVEMGHEVVRFDYMDLLRRFGRDQMNAMLLEAAYRWAPDIVFVVLFTDEIQRETIETITNRRRAVTVNWFCDDHWRFESYSRHWAPCFDWVVTTAASAVPRYLSEGIQNVILSQWGCNHHLYHRMDIPKRYDLSFVGIPHGVRRDMVKRVRAAGLNVRTWGYGWPEGRVSQAQMVQIFNESRINLNFANSSAHASSQIKGRNFEIPGCGGFLLTHDAENLGAYYEIGSEIVCFSTVDDLIEKSKFYLAEAGRREEIAAAAYRRTLRDHTMASRLDAVFARVGWDATVAHSPGGSE